jgi:hypothetical protein
VIEGRDHLSRESFIMVGLDDAGERICTCHEIAARQTHRLSTCWAEADAQDEYERRRG